MSESTPLTQVVRSPVSALARHRSGAPRGSALVMADAHGRWHLVGPGTSARAAGVRFRDVARGRYRSIYEVRLGERFSAFALNLAAGDSGQIVEAEVQLSWWVSDPVATAATRVVAGEPLVRRAVGNRLQRIAQTHPASALAAAEQLAADELRAVSYLDDCGLAYGNGRVVLRLAETGRGQTDELGRLQRELDVEEARMELERRRILFFGELLEAGDQGLLAYWLARSPDDVREVLERMPAGAASWPPAWKAAAAPLPTEDRPAALSAALFDELDEYERQHLREVIVSTLVAMGRDELAHTLVDRPGPAVRPAPEPAAHSNGHAGAQSNGHAGTARHRPAS
jgi:hypothetical protein